MCFIFPRKSILIFHFRLLQKHLIFLDILNYCSQVVIFYTSSRIAKVERKEEPKPTGVFSVYDEYEQPNEECLGKRLEWRFGGILVPLRKLCKN